MLRTVAWADDAPLPGSPPRSLSEGAAQGTEPLPPRQPPPCMRSEPRSPAPASSAARARRPAAAPDGHLGREPLGLPTATGLGPRFSPRHPAVSQLSRHITARPGARALSAQLRSPFLPRRGRLLGVWNRNPWLPRRGPGARALPEPSASLPHGSCGHRRSGLLSPP